MIMDELLEFADDVSVAAAAGTALIGDVIDLGAAARDIGSGEPLYLVIQTGSEEIITAGSAGTLEFQLASDSTANLATSATVHYSTGALVTDDAAVNDSKFNVGGIIACIALPMQGAVYERYLGILAVTATTTTTAGKINAFLTKDVAKWKAYADAI